jgi:3'-phosphoadenosine 5'-phosphosulfate sulfotransferase (PAPS reductase)/FAD synthetase
VTFDDLLALCRAWAELPEYRARVQRAEAEVERALALSARPYAAWSGGKDSTCVVHLVLTRRPEITVVHWDYGPYFIPRPVHREILRAADQLGIRDLRIETSDLYLKLGRRAKNVLGRHYLGGLIPQLAREGCDLAFVGLRTEESLRRRRRIRAGRGYTEIPECWPIAHWRWQDVWTYTLEHNLPILSHYLVYGPVVGWDRVRLSTYFDPEFADRGGPQLDAVLAWKFREVSDEAN